VTYVKTHNGEVAQYPYSAGDLRRDNPNTSFPRQISTKTLTSRGVALVTIDTRPETDPRIEYSVLATTPTHGADGWVLMWSIVDKTLEQRQAYIATEAAALRVQRNRLLAKSDWMALNGNGMTAEWLTYRRALQDVPAQVGFPANVVWPTEPTGE
jgi:hypothetical protein